MGLKMIKTTSYKASIRHTLITTLGIIALALVTLANISSAAPFAYISNNDSQNISVIDTATDTVIATVNVGSCPVGVAVNPMETMVYVANYGSNNVSVIDTANDTVVATVNVGVNPYGVAVNPKGTKGYVANYGSNNFSVIDTANDTVTATVNVGSNPVGVAVDPAGTKVYVTNYGSNNVSVIDTTTNTIIATENVGIKPQGVAVNPAGTKVYVANNGSNNVSVIDTANDTVTATVNVGSNPVGVAVDPAGTKVYVANSGSNNISVIDTATNTVSATVNVGSTPFGIAVNPEGTKVYVANSGSDNVSVIDAANYSVPATENVGINPIAFGQFIVPSSPVIGWELSPEKLVSGDTLFIKGNASPGRKIDAFVNFEKPVPVSGGKFDYDLENVEIPEGFNNFFTVAASGAKNLNVRVKMLIWVTKSAEASNNTAIVSQSNVAPGTYKIRIDGDAGEEIPFVNLNVTAFQEITADSKGNFSYSYNTTSIPPGYFKIKVGGITKEINIQPKNF